MRLTAPLTLALLLIVPLLSAQKSLFDGLPVKIGAGLDLRALAMQTVKSSVSMRCDSLVKDDSEGNRLLKTNYDYDYPNRITTEWSYERREGEWIPRSQESIGEDNKGAVLMKEALLWSAQKETWEGSYREEFTYTPKGLMASHITYQWGEEGWKPSVRKLYTYNDNDHCTQEESQTWAPLLKQWITSSNYSRVYTYDEANHPLTIIFRKWNEANKQWDDTRMQTISYDSLGYTVDSLELYRSPGQNNWIPSGYKMHYANDPYGHLTLEEAWAWSDSAWTLVYRYRSDYELDEKQRVLRRTVDEWQPEQAKWRHLQQQQYTYDGKGNISTCETFKALPESEEWLPQKHYDLFRNEAEYSLVEYTWSTQATDWKPTRMEVRGYTDDGYLALTEDYQWSAQRLAWEGLPWSGRYLYTYDNEGNLLSCEQYDWSADAHEWKLQSSDYFCYSKWSDEDELTHREELHGYMRSGQLVLEGLKQGETVSVVGLDGTISSQQTVTKDELSLSLPKGFSIINVGGRSIKTIIK